MFLKLSTIVRKSSMTLGLVIASISIFSDPETAKAQEVFRNNDVVMGYASATAPANVQGYPNCFTSIGDSMWIRSDNSANQTPAYSVSVATGQISVSQNKHVSARASYVCLKSSTVVGANIKAGYVTSGTSIGANMSCVLSVANFTRVRPPGGDLAPGTVSCAYNSSTGVVTASQTGQGRISACGYVCVTPSSSASSSVSAYRYPATFSGTDSLGKDLSCARGTTNFSTGCSGIGVTDASYSASTGLATKGFTNGCTRGSFSYLCASAATSQCSDNRDNDNDGLIDLKDPGCSSPSDNDESNVISGQCNDGVDNDNDGKIDALLEIAPALERTRTFGGSGDPMQVAAAVSNAIAAKRLPFTRPTTPLVRTDNGSWDSGTPHLPTLNQVCRILGYRAYVSSTCRDGERSGNYPRGKCNFHSPGNNQHFRFNGTNFAVESANPKYGKTWIATITCAGQLTACSDGVDNDGDGKVDLADDGCASASDSDERPHDPQCASPSSPSEFAQCNDSKDNDSDGVTDRADPGCWNDATSPNTYDPNRDNEAAATTQCQDAKDNDGDTLVDAKDPGCFTNPKDPATYDRTRNNESLAGPGECIDGKDNDNDGVTDKNDPGCWTNPLDPNTYNPYGGPESNATTQCQDAKDNDGDTLVDAKDPGCFTNPKDPATYDRTRNNESLAGPGECIDGKDNDNDGLIDAKDPGCWKNPSDPNSYNPLGGPESSATTQCQDTKDNDADGLIDLKDPGCADAQDNDEGDEKALLTVGVECITMNNDGTKTAYFSYNNTTSAEMTVTTNATQGTLNEFATTGTVAPPPTLFKAGIAKGTVVVRFTGDSLTWLVRAQKSSASRATASATTPVCSPVVPKAECRGYQNGVLTVRLGYMNGNSFEQQIPIGPSNGFTPGAVDRGQPNKFFAGTNKSVFQVSLASTTDSMTWVVNGSSVKIDNSIPVCDGECVDTPTGSVTAELDAIAQQLSDVMTRAANVLASAKASGSKKVSATVKRNRTDAERAKKKADDYAAQAKTLTIQFPQVVKTCPQAPAYCETVDRQYAIESLKGLYANQRNSTQRTIARAYFRNTGKTSRTDSLVKQAKDLEQQGLAALAKLPRFETQCK